MKKTLYLLVFYLLLSTPLQAEVRELSLDDCLRLAQQNDRNLQASQAHQETLNEEVNIAQKNLLPTFKLTAGYTLIDRPTRLIIDADSFGPDLPDEDVPLYDSRRFRFASLMVEQPLFLGGALIQKLNRANSLASQSQLELRRQQNLLIRDTKNSFFRALNAQLRRQTSEKMMEVHRERLRLIKEQRTENQAKDEDVLAQQSELAFAESEVYQNRSRERNILNNLRNSLYLDPQTSISLKTPQAYFKLDTEAFNISPATFALNHRNDYLAQQKQIEAIEAEAKHAQSHLYPQVSMFGQYTRQNETNLDRDEIWTAGARLEWSIFAWGKNLAEVRRVRAEKLRAQRQKEAYAEKIRNETSDLWGAVQEKESLIDAWVLRTRLNETKLKRLLEEYHEGKTTWIEILNQEAELVAGYNNYRETINELEINLAYLQAALATPIDQWLLSQEIHQLDVEQTNFSLKNNLNNKTPPAKDNSDQPLK